MVATLYSVLLQCLLAKVSLTRQCLTLQATLEKLLVHHAAFFQPYNYFFQNEKGNLKRVPVRP